MKKIHVILMASLLAFCGVSMTAAILSLAAGEGMTEKVSMPTMEVQAGSTFTVPVSLENINTGYVGFQMDIILPQGVTPVFEDGYIEPTKTKRLNSSHSFSCTFDEKMNTIKMVCTSMRASVISGTSGELFSIDLQADASMKSGDYQIAMANVVFSTASSESGNAESYYLPVATSQLTVSGNDTPTPSNNNSVSIPNVETEAGSTFTVPVSLENTNAGFVGFQMDIQLPQGVTPVFEDGYIEPTKTKRLNSSHSFSCNYEEQSNTIKLVCTSMRASVITGTSGELFSIDLQADASMKSGDYQMALTNVVFSTASSDSGNAESFNLENAYSTLSVQGNEQPVVDKPMIVFDEYVSQGGFYDSETIIKKENVQLTIYSDGKLSVDENHAFFGTKDNKIQLDSRLKTGGKSMSSRYLSFWIHQAGTLKVYVRSASGTATDRNLVLTQNGKEIYNQVVKDEDALTIEIPGGDGTITTQKIFPVIEVPVLEGQVDVTFPVGALNFYGFDFVVEEVTIETLLSRLNDLATTAEQTIQALTYSKVPGATELAAMVTQARQFTEQSDASVLQTVIDAFPSSIEFVTNMDQQYQTLAALLVRVETAAQNNEGADADLVAEVTGKIQQARTALNNGTYGLVEINNMTNQMNNYYSELSQVYLTLYVEQPGTMYNLIQAKGYTVNDIKGLTVSGHLNDSDMQTMQEMKNLQRLDMSETDVTKIPNNQFSSFSKLQSVVLPKNLKTIGEYAFYSCSALTNPTLPEGIQNIGFNAFGYCTSLTAIELPSTLQSLGTYPFYYCQNLKSITYKSMVPVAVRNNLISGGYDKQCTLYVPAIAVSTYQAATGWKEFQIVGIDVMPENILITSNVTLEWPATASTDSKPNLRIDRQEDKYSDVYGSLTMNGTSTVSLGSFTTFWDAYNVINYSEYNMITNNYEWKRNTFASLLANTPMRADKVNVEMKVRTYLWDFVSFPFDVKVCDIQDLNQNNAPLVIRRYDGLNRAAAKMSETWVNVDADGILEAGKGYIWQSADGDQELGYNTFLIPAQNNTKKNNIFTTNDVTVQLDQFDSELSQNRSWNLIGNPYPLFFDIRAIQTTAPITIWNDYNKNYQAYSPAEDTYVLNPGQAFFIQRPLNQESITFLKEGRQTDVTARAEANFNPAGARAFAKSERYVFNLLLRGSEETMGDRTRIVVNPEAMVDYEAGRDASKFMSHEPTAAQLFTTQGNVRFSINERPLQDGIVELGMSIGTAGSYTISLSTLVEGEVYLLDRTLGTETRLEGTEGYTFQAVQGMTEGRFAIRFVSGDATGISDVRGKMEDVRGAVYDLSGRKVANDQKPAAKGLYIIDGKKAVVK